MKRVRALTKIQTLPPTTSPRSQFLRKVHIVLVLSQLWMYVQRPRYIIYQYTTATSNINYAIETFIPAACSNPNAVCPTGDLPTLVKHIPYTEAVSAQAYLDNTRF